jgi:hypothetical protein
VAVGDTLDDIELASGALPVLRSAPPVEFDAPNPAIQPSAVAEAGS